MKVISNRKKQFTGDDKLVTSRDYKTVKCIYKPWCQGYDLDSLM